jgi:dolichol-phosphate mannosyltransferase
VLSSNSINENAADYRLISSRVAKILSYQFKEKNIFLRGIFPEIGFKQIGITYEAEERAAGNSKYTISRMISFAIAGILSTTIKPLHYIIYLGLITSLISLLFLSYVLFEYFLDRSIPSGWSTLAVLVLGFGGLNMLVLGIVGAYIGGIYEEVKLRPRYIVEEEINYEK